MRADEGSADTPLAAPEVVVRAEAPPDRAPTAATTTVEAGEFQGELKSLAELIATAPGVAVRDFGGLGQMATASVRGASADQVQVLLDGVPLNAVAGGGADLAALPEAFIERIEIVRGAEGAAYGSGALGGAIEIRTRRPEPAPGPSTAKAAGGAPGPESAQNARAPASTWRAVGEAAGGSWLTFSGSAAAGGDLGGGWRLLAAGTGRGTRGDYPYLIDLTPDLPSNDAPIELLRQNNDSLFGALLLSATWEPPADSGADRDAAILAQVSGGARGLPGAVRAPTPEGRERNLRALAGARVRLRDLLPLGELQLGAHARLDGLELHAAGPDAADVGQRALDGGVSATWKAVLFGAHRLRADAQVGGETIAGSAFGAPARANAAVSVSELWHAAEPLYLDAALRADIFLAAPGTTVGTIGAVTPRLGALWKPLDWLELRANAGTGFRAPSFGELYMETGPVAPNPELRPERALGADVGVAVRAPGLYAAAGAFLTAYDDLIVYELYPPFRFKPFNAGAARVLGAELEAAWSPLAHTTLSAAYTFLDAVPIGAGAADEALKLPYRAPHRLYLRAARKGPDWEAWAEAHYTAAFPRNRANTKWVADRLALNAGAGLHVYGPLWVSLDVKNLLDDRSMEDVYGYPLPSRGIFLHVRVDEDKE